MAAKYTTLDIKYSYKRVEYNELVLQYSYLPVVYDTNYLGVVYSLSASSHATFDGMTGYWSDHTQIIGNNLPIWHAGRYDETSNYQQFVNSVAINSEYTYDQFLLMRKNLFIDTAEDDVIFSGFLLDYPREIPDSSDRQSSNIIYNSDFSIKGRAISDYPCRWSVDKSSGASVTSDKDRGLSAGNALAIQTNSGEYASVYQSYSAQYPAGQDLVLSAIVNVPNNSSSVDVNASGDAALHLNILYVDGSTDYASVEIPLSTTEEGILTGGSTGQLSYWKRISTSISLTKASANVKCYINSDYRNNTSDALFYADCIQLEEGTKPTRWKRSALDNFPWIYNDSDYRTNIYNVYSNDTSEYTQVPVVLNSNTSYYDVRPKTRLFYTSSERQFYENAIPTRLLSVSSSTDLAISSIIKGVVTSPYDVVISNVQWRPDPSDSSKIKKTSFELNDDHGSYSVAERDYFGDSENSYTDIKDHISSGTESYSTAIRGLTIYGDHLLAFCRESLGTGVYYTFKFIKPRKKFQGTYLECMQDFKVPASVSEVFTGIETGDVLFNSIGKVEGTKNRFIVETNDGNSRYEAVFAYDYYTEAGDGQFFTREKYDQICVT